MLKHFLITPQRDASVALGQGKLAVARRIPYGTSTEEEPKLNKHGNGEGREFKGALVMMEATVSAPVAAGVLML